MVENMEGYMKDMRFISCRYCEGLGLVINSNLPKDWKERVSWSGVGYPDVFHLCSECLREEKESREEVVRNAALQTVKKAIKEVDENNEYGPHLDARDSHFAEAAVKAYNEHLWGKAEQAIEFMGLEEDQNQILRMFTAVLIGKKEDR